MQIRQRLFAEGQSLQNNVRVAKQAHQNNPDNASKERLILCVGALSSYVKIRQALAPTITSDVALNEQQAIVRRTSKEIGVTSL